MAEVHFEIAVIGAGVVGLACAAKLSSAGISVIVLEAESHPGSKTTSRNSEVIHAGLYYPKDSLKHLLCISGRKLLYKYLSDRRVEFRKCGKLIVATSKKEEEKIEKLYANAVTNDVDGISLIDRREMVRLEPEVSGELALLSSETGIFDSHQYLYALIGEIEDGGGIIAYNSKFVSAVFNRNSYELSVGLAEATTLRCNKIINCAGYHAAKVAKSIECVSEENIPEMHFAKGSYFKYLGGSPFSSLIYPAPVEGGLGIHATLDLAGQIRFGPDVEWLSSNEDEIERDYPVLADRKHLFADAIRKYWPRVEQSRLSPDFSGIRAKLSKAGEGARDFEIVPNNSNRVISLYGIESPGLTSSLALAQMVSALALEEQTISELKKHITQKIATK